MLKESKKGHKKSQTAYRNYIALCFLVILALRRQELVGLKWSDLRADSSSINVYTKLVSKVCPEKRITPHSLRKTFIEQALNNNEDFISIINATGHSTVEMVKYYDTRDTLKNNAVHNMGKLV